MPACKAIQVSLKSMHFDRFTTHRMRGYVICLAQRNIDGAGQLYVSSASFPVRRDGKSKTKDDEVATWQGDGEVVFSTALDGLERVGLDLFFVRDNRNIRDFGTVLEDALDEDDTTNGDLAKALVDAARAVSGASGQVIDLVQPAARFVGRLLARKRDRVKIRADGSLRLTTLLTEFEDDPDGDNDVEIPWGVRLRADGSKTRDADKGYFVTQWSLVETADPHASVIVPKLPKSLLARLS